MDYVLYHHGIKGQKWGVRRYRNTDGSLTSAGKKRYTNGDPDKRKQIAKKAATAVAVAGVAAATAYAYSKHGDKIKNFVRNGNRHTVDDMRKATMRADVKNRRVMSTEELKKKIERLEMQKKLKDMTEAEISPGKAFAKKVMSSSGQKVATTLVTGAALYSIKAALTEKFDKRELANYMTPKPKK